MKGPVKDMQPTYIVHWLNLQAVKGPAEDSVYSKLASLSRHSHTGIFKHSHTGTFKQTLTN